VSCLSTCLISTAWWLLALSWADPASLTVIRVVQCNGFSTSCREDSRVRTPGVAGMPLYWGLVCQRHWGRRTNQTPAVLWLHEELLEHDAELGRCDWWSFNKFYKHVTWVNELISYTITSEMLFKRLATFKCYSFSGTTTVSNRATDRWRKYIFGPDKKKNNREETFKKWKVHWRRSPWH
jgi:hypothetical protein